MNFGVIEYASKSGDVWKHSDAKPNFLANPQTEIDPTSFGCYVSALKGEHIPITKLIGARTLITRGLRKIIGHWPQTYPLDYLADFTALLVVYDLGNGPDITLFTKRLKKRYPGIKIIGVPTQPFEIVMDYWRRQPKSKVTMVEFMNSCDSFLSLVKSTTAAWQALTTTNVTYLPQPYPVEHAIENFKPRDAKQKIMFVAGVTDRPDITKGHKVAALLQQKHRDLSIHVTDIPGHALDVTYLSKSRYTKVPFALWSQHLAYLGTTYLVINTDYTQTRGRVQVDCAAVGTPSIGSNSDGQVDLFPEFAATPNTTAQEIAEQAELLLSDPAYYQRVVAYAHQQIQSYRYDQAANRLQQLVTSLT